MNIEFTVPAASIHLDDKFRSLTLIINNKETITMTVAAIMILTTLPITLMRCTFLNLKVLIFKDDRRRKRQQLKSISHILPYLLMLPFYLSLFLFSNIVMVFVLLYIIT